MIDELERKSRLALRESERFSTIYEMCKARVEQDKKEALANAKIAAWIVGVGLLASLLGQDWISSTLLGGSVLLTIGTSTAIYFYTLNSRGAKFNRADENTAYARMIDFRRKAPVKKLLDTAKENNWVPAPDLYLSNLSDITPEEWTFLDDPYFDISGSARPYTEQSIVKNIIGDYFLGEFTSSSDSIDSVHHLSILQAADDPSNALIIAQSTEKEAVFGDITSFLERAKSAIEDEKDYLGGEGFFNISANEKNAVLNRNLGNVKLVYFSRLGFNGAAVEECQSANIEPVTLDDLIAYANSLNEPAKKSQN